MKILVIQTSFIGDVILATGIVEKLHTFYPDAALDILVRKGNESLFEAHPYLKRILIWDKSKTKYKNLFRLLQQIRNTKYDLIINLQRFGASGLLTAFSGAKESRGFEKNPFSFLFTKKFPHRIGADSTGNFLHEIARNHHLIEDLTDAQAHLPKLYPSMKNEEHTALYKTEPYITIAPASVWFTKQYPAEKWINFMDHANGYKIYLLGGKSDIPLCEGISAASAHVNFEILAGKLSFLDTCALMKDAVMNYTNDSGPMHLASAVNAPTAAIFCSTLPEFGFGPLSDKKYIIEIKENLECRPCGIHGRSTCPKGHFKCGFNIDDLALIEILN